MDCCWANLLQEMSDNVLFWEPEKMKGQMFHYKKKGREQIQCVPTLYFWTKNISKGKKYGHFILNTMELEAVYFPWTLKEFLV